MLILCLQTFGFGQEEITPSVIAIFRGSYSRCLPHYRRAARLRRVSASMETFGSTSFGLGRAVSLMMR